MRKAFLFLMVGVVLGGCSSSDSSPEAQAEKAANEKAGPPPAGVTATDVAPMGRRPSNP